ncbi:formate dehydrogenase iron-sulfur subunit [Natronincola peptidivorans]|uniref:Formate dehydrogenase iron-sulfur subunit n=1 Tax=Natronincola peptidivorans TaxID=426128 RepID=A0A1I0BKY6_9FIRM|nr:4Fe-4S dicluster domain-containing protein [Natronincola peptidivorans]SET07665.1 formate dehydrogenase iron-sulfur subunit [Natronincola peptidivorans]
MSYENTAMLVDESLCTGCNACTVVCKQLYKLPHGVFRTKINRLSFGAYPEVKDYFDKRACFHCTDAACVKACPTGACQKDENGLTMINSSLCITCNWCVNNCPFNAVQPDRANGTIEKCTLCSGRIKKDQEPFCAEACTTRAVKFGTRGEMLQLGKKRVSELKSQGYTNAYLYGDYELNGLKVLTVLTDEPEKYNLPRNPKIPISLQIWKGIPFKPLVLAAGGAALAFNALHTRKVKNLQNKNKQNKGGE